MAEHPQNTDPRSTKRLVLVGSGHAHLHVLREWARRSLPGVELVLVVPRAEEWYSGMIPGYLAGRHERNDLRVDLAALARCAGARFVVAEADGVSAAERVVTAAGEVIRFDICSIDIGATMAGADIPGVRDHAIPLRPAERAIELRDRVDALLARDGPPLTVTVVGAGAWGMEVAFALDARIKGSTRGGHVTIVDGARVPLADEAPTLRARAVDLLRERGIGMVLGSAVTTVESDQLRLASGAIMPADLTLWATGAAPPALFAASDLPRDGGGFLLVDRKLRAMGGLPVWGAGDCVTIGSRGRTTRSEAHGEREGAVLLRNLRSALGTGWSRRFHPRAASRTVLGTGDGRAVGQRGYGRLAWWLRERRDRRYVARLALACDEKARRRS